MIATVQNLVIDDRFAVDADAAPMFCEEVEGWQKNERTGKELDLLQPRDVGVALRHLQLRGARGPQATR